MIAFQQLDRAVGAELITRKLAPIEAVPTFLPTWNRACRDEGGGMGLARGWHIGLGGRSGLGKSVWVLNLAASALRSEISVCFLSFEMSWVQLGTRLLSIVSGIPVRNLEQGSDFSEADHLKASKAMHELQERTGAEFWHNRDPLRGLEDATAAIREHRERHGCGLFIVDYIQLAAGDPNDPAEITRASHAVRGLAQELRVVTVGVTQFNRSTSASPEKPTVYGLMGGSALENDADQVLLLDHSRIERAPAPEEGWHGWALLGKNRHGPAAEIPIHLDTRNLRIRERLLDEMQGAR